MIKYIILLILSLTNLFSEYLKTDDNESNVYYSSEHFRVVAGISYIDDLEIKNIAYRYLDSAEITWNKEIVELGFKQPKNSDTKKIDIYIGNKDAIGQDAIDTTIVSDFAGYATSYPSDGTPYFVINPILNDNQIKVTISHEFFHTIQYAYFDDNQISYEKWIKNIWWLEATAVLMEDEVYDDIDDYLYFLNPFFDKSYSSFELYDGSHEYSMVIFAKYIKEKYGLQIIKDSFSSIDTSGDDGYYEILDTLLINNHNSSMKIALNEFAKWISNSPKYFEEGSLYPELKHFKTTDNITIEKGGIVVMDNLNSGWNMTALSNTNISNLDILNLKYIWSYQDGIWSNNLPSTNYKQISDINSTKGYWVNVDNNSSNYYTYYDSVDLDISGLSAKWHLLSTTKKLNMDLFNNTQVVWQYKNNEWFVYTNKDTDYKVIDSILPYSSYWVLK
ncbi:MAG: hypothetical protein U9N59_06065 [Campylobacterota bacterium]|nr:hypothetical protein [Campylobacterota bacterium]